MSTTNNQSIQQINTAALCGTGEGPHPDDFKPDSESLDMANIFRADDMPATKLQAGIALHNMRGFIGTAQLSVIGELCWGEEKQWFFNKLVEMANIVQTMPTTYQTDGQGDLAVVQLHYFTAGADWYITERDCESEQLQAFGKADLGYGGELGYISIVELLEAGAELDLHWTPKTLSQVNAEQQMQDVNYTGHPMHY